MTLNLFGDVEQGRMWREELCPGAVVLRGFAVLGCNGHLRGAAAASQPSAVSSHDHAGRLPHVRGDDELRRVWLGDGSHGLPLRRDRPGHRQALAPHAGRVSDTGTSAAASAGFEGFNLMRA